MIAAGAAYPATRRLAGSLILALAGVLAVAAGEPPALRFEDVTAKLGLARYLEHWELGHAAAWGDVDGDGRPDLYFGSFADRPLYRAADAPIPNLLFLNKPDGFVFSEQPALEFRGVTARAAHAVFADLDNDGDLDLVVANHVFGQTIGERGGEDAGRTTGTVPSALFENTGAGQFRLVPPAGPWPPPIGMRNVAPVDVDGDGLLDLLICDGSYHTERANHLRVLRNLGKLQFEDATAKFGLPEGGTGGLGLAVGDLNDDGRLDFFIAGCYRLFLSSPTGGFREATATGLAPPRLPDRNAMICGATFGDLNGDGRLDLVVTLHGRPTRLYVYTNETKDPAAPKFVDRSVALGLDRPWPREGVSGVQVKTAHVELQDMDNDGRPDLVLAVIWRDEAGQVQPLVLRNLGVTDGLPRFSPVPLDRLVGYYAPGPVNDFDGDGRLDVFLPSWFPPKDMPTALFRNVTPGGHYLRVRVRGDGKTRNAMGIGAVVRTYRAGQAGQAAALLGRADLAIGVGYASGQEPVAHFGLGEQTTCDVVVTWGSETRTLPATKADQTLVLPFPAP